MSRNVYISCDSDERDLPSVKSVQGFLQSQGCNVEFAPPRERDLYKTLEKQLNLAMLSSQLWEMATRLAQG
jgi:hypothetical protein